MTATVQQPDLSRTLRKYGQRLGNLEGQVGRWVYVTPVSPSSPPPDYNPDDPLSPPFQNGWGNAANETPLSFRLHPATVVQIRSGALVGGTIPSVVFTFPAPYRPTQGPTIITFANSEGDKIYTGRIDTNGDFTILDEGDLSTPIPGIACETVNVCNWLYLETNGPDSGPNGFGIEIVNHNDNGTRIFDDGCGGMEIGVDCGSCVVRGQNGNYIDIGAGVKVKLTVGTGSVCQFLDGSGNPVFEVHEDGSIHGLASVGAITWDL